VARGPSVRLLGPLYAAVDGRTVELPTGRLMTLLAVLAMSAGKPVPAERLADFLWADEQPGNARRIVQTHLARLRTALGAEAISTTPHGYTLRANPEDVDALRFHRLLDAAAGAPDRTVERGRLGEALALWRGLPFEGINSDRLHRMEAAALLERYLAAVERRVDLDLAAGRTSELMPQLQELAEAYPLRESLWVRLLTVLGHCGRQAEALERYESIRVRLADELGVDPGSELQQTYTALLAGRPPAPSVPSEPVPATRAVPQQLPGDIPAFAGRDHALATLTDLLGIGGPPSAAVVAVVTGTAGVGKTALAAHWAHQIRGHFGDGQLYVNLRGFDPAGQPMAPAEALRLLLDALGVPPHRVPTELDAQIGLYRTTLTGKRVLILLDNARDADQVRPLLPGAPGCLAVVTSRDQLSGLIVTEAATPVVLDLLTPYEAQDLLTRRLGKDRLAAEPAAVDRIIAGCARLPLALAITAARAATRPGFPLATLADQLGDPATSLATFEAGDAATNVRAVFASSYQALGPASGALFRQLSLSIVPDISTGTAASLAGIRVRKVQPLLAELSHAHLLTEHLPGRYTCHDLLRAYANELSQETDPAPARQAARRRLVDHYLRSAHAAATLLYPHREPITLPARQPGVHIEPIVDRRQALTWFHAEQPALLASLTHAAELGDRQLEAAIRVHLGDACLATGDPDAARAAWRHALSILDDLQHPDARLVADRLDRSTAGRDGRLGGPDQR
jgi:DNA-binding SARP family transcriptional activator